jgi:hypothetical protein
VVLQSGEIKSRHLWEATITVAVVPPTTEENEEETKRNWRNGLGILVNEVHWLDLGDVKK